MVWCGAVQFMWFSYYKIANRTAPCGVVRCDYAILLAVLVHFCSLCGLCGLVNTPNHAYCM